MTKSSELYDRDFARWTADQAAALRRAKRSNLPLDWENLGEEIEDLGKSRRTELRSQIRRVLRHLFKLEASPASELRAGWRATILEARGEIEDLLWESPSLRRLVDGYVADQAARAAKLAASDLGQHDEPGEAVWTRLDQGGFTPAQVLEDWFPEA
jgi:hypothetical protein